MLSGSLCIAAWQFPLDASKKWKTVELFHSAEEVAARSLRQVGGLNSHGRIGVQNFPGHVGNVHPHRFLDPQS